MKLYIGDADTAAAVLETVAKLPEEVRAVAMRAVWLGVGKSAAGMLVRRDVLDGAEHVILILERDAELVQGTAAHEVGHMMSPEAVGPEGECVACQLARLWGFDTIDTDPARAAWLTELNDLLANQRVKPMVDDTTARFIHPTCGLDMFVIAPTLPGQEAEIGLHCRRCREFGVWQVRDLIRCICGKSVAVTWATNATPQAPVVVTTCACGATKTLTLIRQLTWSEQFIAAKSARRQGLSGEA